jgi:hypothetical protein
MRKEKEVEKLKNEISLLKKMLEFAFHDTDERDHYGLHDWLSYLEQKVILKQKIESMQI